MVPEVSMTVNNLVGQQVQRVFPAFAEVLPTIPFYNDVSIVWVCVFFVCVCVYVQCAFTNYNRHVGAFNFPFQPSMSVFSELLTAADRGVGRMFFDQVYLTRRGGWRHYPEAMAMMATFVFVEEVVKRFGATWVLIICETLCAAPHMGRLHFTFYVAFKVLAHWILFFNPFWAAFVFHFWWNGLVWFVRAQPWWYLSLPVNATTAMCLGRDDDLDTIATFDVPPEWCDDDVWDTHVFDLRVPALVRQVAEGCIGDAEEVDVEPRMRGDVEDGPDDDVAQWLALPRLRAIVAGEDPPSDEGKHFVSAKTLQKQEHLRSLRCRATRHARAEVAKLTDHGWSQSRVWSSVSEAFRAATHPNHCLSRDACERVLQFDAAKATGVICKPAPSTKVQARLVDGHVIFQAFDVVVLSLADFEFQVLARVSTPRRRDLLRVAWIARDRGAFDLAILVWNTHMPARPSGWQRVKESTLTSGDAYRRKAIARCEEAAVRYGYALPVMRNQAGEWFRTFTDSLISKLSFSALRAMMASWVAVYGNDVPQVKVLVKQFDAAVSTAHSEAVEAADACDPPDLESWWDWLWARVQSLAVAASEWREVPILSALWRMLSCVSVAGVASVCRWGFDSSSVLGWATALETIARRDTSPMSLLAHLFNAVTEFVGMARDWIRSGDLFSLHRVDSVASLRADTTFLLDNSLCTLVASDPIQMRNFRRAAEEGLVPLRFSRPLSGGERAAVAEDLVARCRASMRIAVAGDRAVLEGLVARLQSYIHTHAAQERAGAQRIEGLGVILLGMGGTGKSTFAHSLMSAFARRVGLPTAQRHIMRYMPNANFQDGALPGQWGFLMDDPELGILPQPGMCAYYADEFTKYLNVQPYNIEAAAVDKKGSIFADFVTGVICTNTPPTLWRMLTDPLPFWRRCAAYIEVKTRAQYATAGGRLDPSKLDGSDDYFEYHVRTFDDSNYNPAQAFSSLPFTPYVRVMSSAECCRFVVDILATHYERGRAFLERRTPEEEAYCSVCYLARTHHPRTMCPGGEYFVDGKTAGVQTKPPVTGELRYVPVGGWLSIPPARDEARKERGPKRKEQSFEFTLAALLVLVAFLYCKRSTLLVLHAAALAWIALATDPEVLAVVADIRQKVADPRVRAGVQTATAAVQRIGDAGSAVQHAKTQVQQVVTAVSDCGEALLASAREHEGAIAMVLGALAVALAAAVAWKMTRRKHASINQAFIWEADVNAPKPGWDRVPLAYFVPTNEMRSSTHDTLCERVRRSTGVVFAVCGSENRSQFYFRVQGNACLIARHLLLDKAGKFVCSSLLFVPSSIEGQPNGDPIAVTPILGVNVVQVASRDLCVVRVEAMLTGDLNCSRLVAQESGYAKQSVADQVSLVKAHSTLAAPSAMIRKFRTTMWVYDADTRPGDCGSVLVASYGKASFIAGIHVARLGTLDEWGKEAYAEELVWQEVTEALNVINPHAYTQQSVVCERLVTVGKDDIHLGPMPAHSSFHVARTIHARQFDDMRSAVYPLGSLQPPKPLSTFRTKVQDSLLRPSLKQYEDELWGVGKRVGPPVFKGRVIEVPGATSPLYTDAWVDNCLAFNNASAVRADVLRLAVDDFWHDAPDLGEYRPVTLYEAVMGRPGEFEGLRLDTSAGQPCFGAKGNWCDVDRDRKVISLHPVVSEQLNYCLTQLAAGVSPMVVFTHVLKDEPTTKDFPRVFNVGPLVLLLLTRMYVWPIFAALRKHGKFSECSIGINLLGCTDVEKFCAWFTRDRVDALVMRFTDGDFKWFDVSNPAAITNASREIVVIGAKLMKASVVFLPIIDGIMLMTVQTIRFIKNDLFMVVGMTPSGVLITGELNSANNSVIARCSYYTTIALKRGLKWEDASVVWTRELLGNPPWFREVVVYQSVGDDNLGSSTTEHFSMRTMHDFCALIGMVYTRADKRSFGDDAPDRHAFTACSYLKRSFRYDEEYKCWKACLEKKSIIKMMLMEKDSTLSRPDHCAILALNACREAFYHGREYFAEICAASRNAMEAAGLLPNAHYHVRSYEYYQEQFMAGTLKTWGPDMDKAESLSYLQDFRSVDPTV